MENKLESYKPSPKSSPKNTIYATPNQFSKIAHYETDIGNTIIHSNESLSNIIDIISNNNLNLFYQDDSTNFKRNIDSLNLKFYLETEKMLSANMNNSSNLFFILFKQMTLYIKEIERLNIIILGLKKDQESAKKMEYFIQKREMDFENKINMINALRFSKDDLEKKVNSLMASENNLKKETLRLIQENLFYSNNNIINNFTYIDNKDKDKENNKIVSINEKKKKMFKEELFINKKYIKTNSNLINNNKKNIINNNLKHNSISNNKDNKANKEISKIYKSNAIDNKNIMISVKRDENLLLKGHRRNYSDQIGVGNNSNNSHKKKLKNSNTIKINKNNIISFGVSTPKNKPVQINQNQIIDYKLNQNSKNKNSKSIKNDNKKKLFNKKKTYNIINNFTNKSIHIDFKSNNKNNNLMKCSSLVFNKNKINEQMNGNMNINSTESNYEISLGNEIDELTMIENLLNQVKDYINSNRNTKNNICKASPKIK